MTAPVATDHTAEPAHAAEAPAHTAAATSEVAVASMKVWIPAARIQVVTAMEAAGIEVIDTPEGAAYAVVSTRLARHRIGEYVTHAGSLGLGVIVLVHPGGEILAVEALKAGGQVAIAEGDVAALRALYHESDTSTDRIDSLLDAYEARLGRTQAATRSNVSFVDAISGLPAAGALATRMAQTNNDPDQNLRLVTISISGLTDGTRTRLGNEAQVLLHRRMSVAVRLVTQPVGEVYDIGDGTFVVLSPQLTTLAVERLGRTLADVVESYTPDGHLPMTVAIGHAGPECSTDLSTLRELAGRAEASARAEERSTVLGAGELVRPLATATELDVTLRLAEMAGERAGAQPRKEVATVANDLATRLGFEGRERLFVRFCAEVADIGSALSVDEGGRVEQASKLLGTTAGPTVALALRSISEHWDGTGGPDGLGGADIPAAARIIAVAEALVSHAYSMERIERGAGTRFDPTVVGAAAELVRQR
ncbi:MAG TPA: HD domain-containing phosphohydrolase [Ilumatobacteraceae bacterium]